MERNLHKPPSEREEVANPILGAVKENRVGKNTIAKILAGSSSKTVSQFKKGKSYGALFWYTIPSLEGFIEQLLELGLIKTVDAGSAYPRPVLVLTPKGIAIIETGAKIPLLLPEPRPTEEPLEMTDTLKATLEIFRERYSIHDVASKRKLASSTVYDHLWKLIKLRHIDVDLIVGRSKKELILWAVEKEKAKAGEIKQLSGIKKRLPGWVSYEEIRCVLASVPPCPPESALKRGTA